MPLKLSKDWFASARVGFQETAVLGSGAQLSLCVEKNFTCVDEREEDGSDNYPNPLEQQN